MKRGRKVNEINGDGRRGKEQKRETRYQLMNAARVSFLFSIS